MMRRRRMWQVGLVFLTAIAIVGFFWNKREAKFRSPMPVKVSAAINKSTLAQPEPGMSEEAQRPIAINTGATLETLMQSELPSPELPLAQTYATLVEKANAGDNRASCRLGLEFSRCAAVPERVAQQNRGALLSMSLNELELEKLRTLAADCASFQLDADLNAMQWLLKAAKAGNPSAQAELTRNERPLPHMAIARPEFLQEFVRIAPDILRSRAQKGDESAARKLASIYAPFANDIEAPSWLSHVIKPDPVLARAYLRLAHMREAQKSPTFFAAFMPSQAGQQLNYQNDRHSQERLMFDAGLSQEQIRASEVLAQEMFSIAAPKIKARYESAQTQSTRFRSEPQESLFMRRCEVTEPTDM